MIPRFDIKNMDNLSYIFNVIWNTFIVDETLYVKVDYSS